MNDLPTRHPRARKSERFVPVGADDPLPDFGRVRVTAEDLEAASALWDAEMPEKYQGLLNAEVVE